MPSNKLFENLELPPRPQEPNSSECCGRNCEYCIYVYYENALRRWEEKVKIIKYKLTSEITT